MKCQSKLPHLHQSLGTECMWDLRQEKLEDAAPVHGSPSAKVESEASKGLHCIAWVPFVQNTMSSKDGFSRISALQVRPVPQRQQ